MIGADTSFLVQLEVQEHPTHAAAIELLHREVLDADQQLALVPQVLAEFAHVVTDPRRFANPLSMEQALGRASFWWNAAEVQHVFSTAESTQLFLQWMREHQLGRKRLLDTQLAATLWTAGVRRIVTSNAVDFQAFGVFDVIVP